MNDKYGIKLELDTNQFKSKLNETASLTKKFFDRVKEDFKGIKGAIDFRISLKGASSEELKSKINEIEKVLEGDLKVPVELKLSDAERGQLQMDLELAKNKLKEVEQQAKSTHNSVNKIGNTKLSTNLGKEINKGYTSIKKLTLGFLSVRTAFSLFINQLNAYRSENEQFNASMTLTSDIITQALAPAFEWFGNMLQYAMIGLARIVELLFGVNILSKVTSNGLKKASQSAKELNDNLSGLDEISNIDDSASGLSTGIGAQLNALDEFQKKIAEVDEWLEKSGIKKFLQDISPLVKDVFGWISERPLETLGLIGGVKLLTSLLPGLLGTSGVGGTGLLGLISTLGKLGIIGIVTTGVLWVADEVDKANRNAQDFSDDMDKIIEKYDEMIKVTQRKIDLNPTEENFNLLITLYKSKKDAIKSEIDGLKSDLTWYNWVIDPASYYDTKDKIKSLEKELSSVEKDISNAKIELNKSKGKADELKTGVSEIFDKKYTLKIEPIVDTKGADTSMNNFVSKWKNKLQTNLSVSSNLKLPSYDVGTDYVPRDQIALIHEGERIIPKQYNNSEYLGQLGNSVTNELLMELNRSILEFANRPQTFNVNGKELAKATYSDFQEESSRRGTNTFIRRV